MARNARRAATSSSSAVAAAGTTAAAPSSTALRRRRRRVVPNRLNLTIIVVLQPVFLLATAFFIASPLLSPATHEELASAGLASRYIARLARTSGDRLVTAAYKALVAVFVVQGWWCTRIGRWCRAAIPASLPSPLAQTQTAPPKTGAMSGQQTSASAKQPDEQGENDQRIGKKDVEEVALSIFSLPLLVAFFDLVIILFGAPISRIADITLLSSYLSLLVGLPLVHVLGVPFLSSSPSPATSVQDKAQGAAAKGGDDGEALWLHVVELSVAAHPFILPLVVPAVAVLTSVATLGAACLALDWEREWQRFPIPCIAAALVGLVVGNALTAVRAWR